MYVYVCRAESPHSDLGPGRLGTWCYISLVTLVCVCVQCGTVHFILTNNTSPDTDVYYIIIIIRVYWLPSKEVGLH